MSSQDNLEKVLRDIHVLISRSEVYSPERIIVNKQEMFELIDRLNASIYEIMEEYELTRQSRDKAEREHKKQGDKIIWDASRKAEDIYAASVMYTDEALNHVQKIMEESTEQIREIQEAVIRDMEDKVQIVRTNQLELKAQLQDLVDTEKYLLLIDERNKEIQREKEKHGSKFGEEAPREKSQFADVKTEIRINKEYFRNAGIALEENEEEISSEETAAVGESSAEEGLDHTHSDDYSMEAGQEMGADPVMAKEEEIDLSGAIWDLGDNDSADVESRGGSERQKWHLFRK